MKKYFFVLILVSLGLVSCDNDSNPNDPYGSNSNSQQRDYCYATFTNTTKNYVVQVFMDGNPLYYYSSSGDLKEIILVPSASYYNYKIKDLSFSKDITFEYHEVTKTEGSTYYYSKNIEKTIGKKGFKFYYNLDYKFTIRGDEVSYQSVYAD